MKGIFQQKTKSPCHVLPRKLPRNKKSALRYCRALFFCVFFKLVGNSLLKNLYDLIAEFGRFVAQGVTVNALHHLDRAPAAYLCDILIGHTVCVKQLAQ